MLILHSNIIKSLSFLIYAKKKWVIYCALHAYFRQERIKLIRSLFHTTVK